MGEKVKKVNGEKMRKMSFSVPERLYEEANRRGAELAKAFNVILRPVYNGEVLHKVYDCTEDVWSLDITDDRWIIDNLIEDIDDTQLLLLSGREKAGKSWICLQLVIALCSGGEAFGRLVSNKHKVVMYSPELSNRTMRMRLERYLSVDDVREDVVNNLKIISSNENLDISDEFDLDEIVSAVNDFDADILVIDPLVKVVNADENDNIAMARILGSLRNSFKNPTLVVLIHHNNKAGTGYRGASSIGGEVDYLFNCDVSENSEHKETKITLKSRHGGYFNETKFWWKTEDGQFSYGYFEPSKVLNGDVIKLLGVLENKELSRSEVMDILTGDSTVRLTKLKKLISDEIIVKDTTNKQHKYRLGSTQLKVEEVDTNE